MGEGNKNTKGEGKGLDHETCTAPPPVSAAAAAPPERRSLRPRSASAPAVHAGRRPAGPRGVPLRGSLSRVRGGTRMRPGSSG